MKKTIFTLATLCLFFSCKKTTFINPSAENLSYPIQGGEKLDTIHADGDWEVKTCPDWLHIEKQDSVLKCVADENKSGAKRDGEITLEGDEVTRKITVTQAFICTRLIPDTTSMSFEKEGGKKSINIDTDGYDIHVEVNGNMTAKYDNGKLMVEVPANEGASSSGKIILTSDSQKAEIKVSLKGAICPRCGGSGKVKCTKCGGQGYEWLENDDMTYGCTRCGGSGSGFLGYPSPQDNLRKGTGMMTCPVCHGNQ